MRTSPSFQWLHFSRKERIGILFMLAILVLLYAYPLWQLHQNQSNMVLLIDSSWVADSIPMAGSSPETSAPGYSKPSPTPLPLFYFDPNSLDAVGFARLGLRSATIRTLLAYRRKGGKFYTPDDLGRIYGLTSEEGAKLKPYIRIHDALPPEKFGAHAYSKPFKTTPSLGININQADSAQWERLPGIGPVLAARIIRFRDKLGGFFSVEQVKETYGLADSVFEKISPFLKCDGMGVIRLPVNTAAEATLAGHPYIGKALAKEMIAYRTVHGPFPDTTALLKLYTRPPQAIRKIFPYINWKSDNK